MFCNQCGTEFDNNANFCTKCGAPNDIAAMPRSSASSDGSRNAQSMTFGNSIAVCFAKYADFNGRASRPEYWWFYLFTVILGWGVNFAFGSFTLTLVIDLAMWLPTFAAAARRLHDTNRSGWRQLWMLTIIGIIPLIIWLASEGDPDENEFGLPT